MKITARYFAQLADLAGKPDESFELEHDSPEQLYTELRERYHFPLRFEEVQVAINHQLSSHHSQLREGDEIAFLPPMTGG